MGPSYDVKTTNNDYSGQEKYLTPCKGQITLSCTFKEYTAGQKIFLASCVNLYFVSTVFQNDVLWISSIRE